MLLKHYILVKFPFVHCDKCLYIRLCWYSSRSLCSTVDETISATQGAPPLRLSEHMLGALPPDPPHHGDFHVLLQRRFVFIVTRMVSYLVTCLLSSSLRAMLWFKLYWVELRDVLCTCECRHCALFYYLGNMLLSLLQRPRCAWCWSRFVPTNVLGTMAWSPRRPLRGLKTIL